MAWFELRVFVDLFCRLDIKVNLAVLSWSVVKLRRGWGCA